MLLPHIAGRCTPSLALALRANSQTEHVVMSVSESTNFGAYVRRVRLPCGVRLVAHDQMNQLQWQAECATRGLRIKLIPAFACRHQVMRRSAIDHAHEPAEVRHEHVQLLVRLVLSFLHHPHLQSATALREALLDCIRAGISVKMPGE